VDPVVQPTGVPKPTTPPPAAPPVAGAPPVVPSAVVEPPKPAAPDMAALVAKEKAFVEQQRKLAADRDAFKKEKSEYDAWKAAKAAALKNPEELAKSTWGDDWYEKLTEYRLNGNKLTPELVDQRVEARINELESKQQKEREEQLAAERERVATQEKEILDTFRKNTVEWVKTKTDDYELINLFGMHDAVHRLVEKTFADTTERDTDGNVTKPGRLLTAKEAADLVEQNLLEQAKKSQAAKKLQARNAAPGTPVTPVFEKRTDPAQPRTVTNDLGARTTPPPPESGLQTDAERIAAAIAAGEAARKARQG
jgi:hypothetical protein